ncbi:ABC transporter ATP-binding protein [Kribbella sp. GL6]|uniref:ABC transporter ATP-binding protein n=1 Tax=Kribbella sp. GL6 TaxID=3419765 RepID=UPI003CFE12E7
MATPKTEQTGTHALHARQVSVGYDGRTVCEGIDLEIEPGTVTCLIGPNGSGKSTLLKGCARLLDLKGGEVFIEGTPMSRLSSVEVARRLAVLPQSPTTPPDLTVRELVEQGRYPHVGALRMLRRHDGEVVAAALAATGMSAFADRDVDALSGGERQRAWIALALAQETPTLFLDEPTTYLDISYQLEVMHLVQELNTTRGITVVMVLHDLNQAAAYSDRIVCLRKGTIVADGAPSDVLTVDLLRDVFRIEATVLNDPVTGKPVFLPQRPLGAEPNLP